MSDAELMDSIDYTVFPNFHPWGAFNRIVYRFRPNGDDHRSSIMECIFLAPFSGERPPNVPVHFLEEHETFTDAPELGMLGKVFNQDLFNMARVQQGLETTRKPGVTLGNYQESKIRWLHDKLDRVGGGRAMKGIHHPLTGALYERDGDGVPARDRRRPVGVASAPTARWIEGELRECDPQLCGWVAGPQVPHHRIADAEVDDRAD